MQKVLIEILVCLSIISLASSCTNIQLPLMPTDEEQGLIDTQAAQTISVVRTRNAPTATTTIRPTRVPRTSTPTSLVISTTTDTPEPTPLPTALFTDDFSTNTGWATQENDDYGFGFKQGGYYIRVGIPNATIWSAKSIDVTDIQIQTQVMRLEGPDTGYFGVMCRQQQDGFNYYILVINIDGSYGIGKVVNGTLQFIQDGVDQNGVINKGNESNQITASCVGDVLTLAVNDQELVTAQDDTFNSGTIGLVAGLKKGEELSVLFDYFIAQVP